MKANYANLTIIIITIFAALWFIKSSYFSEEKNSFWESGTVKVHAYSDYELLLINTRIDSENHTFTVQGRNIEYIASAIANGLHEVEYSIDGIRLTSEEKDIFITNGTSEHFPVFDTGKNHATYLVTGIAKYHEFLSQHEFEEIIFSGNFMGDDCLNGGPGATQCRTVGECEVTCGDGYYACCYFNRCICVCDNGNCDEGDEDDNDDGDDDGDNGDDDDDDDCDGEECHG